MANISITDKINNQSNLLYVQNSISELVSQTGSRIELTTIGDRAKLLLNCPEEYAGVCKNELADKVAEVIAINYKYDFFKKNIRISGLSSSETEILLTSLIAADLEEDKKYSYEKLREYNDISVDGIYNFRMQPLKNKWSEVISYLPASFVNSQLKEFIGYLLENKRKRIYIDDGKVYDCYYRRLKRCSLLGGDKICIVREVLLSNCGEIELNGSISQEEEYYLKEFYKDKIYFSTRYPN